MIAKLVGGAFDGTARFVDPVVDAVNEVAIDGCVHSYQRALGSTFGIGPKGQRVDEEAFFVHSTVLDHGLRAVMDHIESAGL